MGENKLLEEYDLLHKKIEKWDTPFSPYKAKKELFSKYDLNPSTI